MAIHPAFADAILDGRKRVEFRKRALAPDVHTVLVYATAPVQRIVGEFGVDGTTIDTPTGLWNTTGDAGCIDRGAYDAYYGGSTRAAGIHVSRPRRYSSPLALAELSPPQAIPQSFAYLATCTLEAARGRQAR